MFKFENVLREKREKKVIKKSFIQQQKESISGWVLVSPNCSFLFVCWIKMKILLLLSETTIQSLPVGMKTKSLLSPFIHKHIKVGLHCSITILTSPISHISALNCFFQHLDYDILFAFHILTKLF